MEEPRFKPYRHPAGGWGSARSVADILRREGVLLSAPIALSRHNKVDGYQCNSCAWVKPANPLPFEYCENGVKAVAWEITAHRCTPDFFASHTVTELRSWDDYHLEQAGRLTHPLRYDSAIDKYVPVSWGHAVTEIARALRAVEDRRKGTVFYSSGRLSNEASYLYQLFARLYGNNNLPDSSNMWASAPSRWTTSPKPTASCSLARTPAATRPACFIRCRKRAAGAHRSSLTTRCASVGLSGF
jgi:anaerobic selenocysteine-containing dehydrogenase